jgi:hypothetical protein
LRASVGEGDNLDFYSSSLTWKLVQMYEPQTPKLERNAVVMSLFPTPAIVCRIGRGLEPLQLDIMYIRALCDTGEGRWLKLHEGGGRQPVVHHRVMGLYKSRQSMACCLVLGSAFYMPLVFLAFYSGGGGDLPSTQSVHAALDAAGWDPRRVEDDCVRRALRFVEYSPLGSGGSGSGGVRVYTVGRAVEEDREVSESAGLFSLKAASLVALEGAGDNSRAHRFSIGTLTRVLDYVSRFLREAEKSQVARARARAQTAAGTKGPYGSAVCS